MIHTFVSALIYWQIMKFVNRALLTFIIINILEVIRAYYLFVGGLWCIFHRQACGCILKGSLPRISLETVTWTKLTPRVLSLATWWHSCKLPNNMEYWCSLPFGTEQRNKARTTGKYCVWDLKFKTLADVHLYLEITFKWFFSDTNESRLCRNLRTVFDSNLRNKIEITVRKWYFCSQMCREYVVQTRACKIIRLSFVL